MAKEGRIRPDDFIKEEGTSEWVRVDAFAELYPKATKTDETVEVIDEPNPLPKSRRRKASTQDSPLTVCKACGQKIAKEAASCPGCGAPNHWTHPRIVHFLRRRHLFNHIPNFTVEARGYVLAGKSTRPKQFLDVAADAVGGLSLHGPLTGRGILKLLGLSIGATYTSDALRRKAGRGQQVFVIDFRHGQPIWQSTDDEFCADVMDFFKL